MVSDQKRSFWEIMKNMSKPSIKKRGEGERVSATQESQELGKLLKQEHMDWDWETCDLGIISYWYMSEERNLHANAAVRFYLWFMM